MQNFNLKFRIQIKHKTINLSFDSIMIANRNDAISPHGLNLIKSGVGFSLGRG